MLTGCIFFSFRAHQISDIYYKVDLSISDLLVCELSSWLSSIDMNNVAIVS